MGDPRNPARRDEKWDPARVGALESQLRLLFGPSELRAGISGGWAWHFMSPPHEEYKLLHDHKDVDVIIPPEMAGVLIPRLQEHGYKKQWTQYDSNKFHRYEKHVSAGAPVKVQIDLFLEPGIELIRYADMWLIEPKTLLGFYDRKQHTTDDCVAVKAARKLIKTGTMPMGRPELIQR